MSIVAAIQMSSTSDVAENLAVAKTLMQQAASEGAKLVVLPEMFVLLGAPEAAKLQIKETLGNGLMQNFLAQTAKELNLWIVGGTIPLASKHSDKVFATCLVYDNQGCCITRYDKMHLFDAIISPTEQHRESSHTVNGQEVTVIDTPIGRLGLAVCYDIRFPELFRKMLELGAEIFAVPAAFTVPTGTAHWEVLLRARAIENLCYVIGAAQVGTHANGRQTYGHSCIIDPWGKILTCLPDQIGIITETINKDEILTARQRLPIQQHIRFSIELDEIRTANTK